MVYINKTQICNIMQAVFSMQFNYITIKITEIL